MNQKSLTSCPLLYFSSCIFLRRTYLTQQNKYNFFYNSLTIFITVCFQAQLLLNANSVKDYHLVRTHLPKLRHLLRVDPDETTCKHVISILHEFSSLCLMSPDSDEPNFQNQIMLINFGLYFTTCSLLIFS